MYTEEDLTTIRVQQKKRWRILMIPCVVLLAVVVFSVVIRLQWLTTAATILLGATIIAGYDLFIHPLRCYQTHVNNALHGRTRTVEGTYVGLSEDVSLVDGVHYRALTLHEDASEEDCDRMLYFDMEKPFPTVEPGQRIRVVYHDREIADLALL